MPYRAALREARLGCAHGAREWLVHGEIERAAAVAEACGEDKLAARAWLAVGAWSRASDAFARGRGEDTMSADDPQARIRAHLFAGELARASAEARALAEALPYRPTKSESGMRRNSRKAALVSCVADALDARRGDRAAIARLLQDERKPRHPACVLLLADLHRGSQRSRTASLLSSSSPGSPGASARLEPGQDPAALFEEENDFPLRWLEVFKAEIDPEAHVAPELRSSAASLLLDPGAALVEALPAIERRIADELSKQPGTRGRAIASRRHAAASAAAFALAAGDLEEARRLAKIHAADTEAIARRSDGVVDALVFGGALPPANLEQAAALEAAVERARGDRARGPERAPPSAPRAHADVWEDDPQGQMIRWAELAARASAAGDAARAAELSARARRFYDALLRRDIAVPLALLRRI